MGKTRAAGLFAEENDNPMQKAAKPAEWKRQEDSELW